MSILSNTSSKCSLSDCTWSCAPSDDNCVVLAYSYITYCSCHKCGSHGHYWLPLGCSTFSSSSCQHRTIGPLTFLWDSIVAVYRSPRCPHQNFPASLSQLDYPTGLLDKCGICVVPCTIRDSSRRTHKVHRALEYPLLECEHFPLG